MGREQTVAYYEQSAANPAKYFNLPPTECCLYPVWAAVADEIPSGSRVVDLGCGAGHLAQIAHQRVRHVTEWTGLDFSPSLVAIANRRRLPENYVFRVQDVVSDRAHLDDELAVYVATDFLEHIDEDLSILSSLPMGARVVFSLPPHDHETHVRHFPTMLSIVRRYEPLIEITKVEVVGPSALLVGRTR